MNRDRVPNRVLAKYKLGLWSDAIVDESEFGHGPLECARGRDDDDVKHEAECDQEEDHCDGE